MTITPCSQRFRSVYIEAFGPPAVGKSYVAGQIVAAVRSAGSPLQIEPYSLAPAGRSRRTVLKIAITLRYLSVIAPRWRALIAVAYRTPWVSTRGAARGLANWVQLIAMIRYLHGSNAPILLSQGIGQAMWSLRFRSVPSSGRNFPMRAWLDLTLSLLPDRELVVLSISAESNKVRERLYGRRNGQSVLDREASGCTAVRMQTDIALREVRAELENLQKTGRLRIIDFDNSKDDIDANEAQSIGSKLGILFNYDRSDGVVMSATCPSNNRKLD